MIDINYITNSILSFYDFMDKNVAHIGAGSGQLLAYSKVARQIKAIDIDSSAINILQKRIKSEGIEDRMKAVALDFMDFKENSDVVFFEFCLHEMDDPYAAILHAKEICEHVLILDHTPYSKWSWYALEEKKLARSWQALESFKLTKKSVFDLAQEYDTYDDLKFKLSSLGEKSIGRIKELQGCESISISMPFALIMI